MPEAPKMTPSDLKMNPGTFQDLPKWTPRPPKVTTQPPKLGQWHPMAPNVNTMVPWPCPQAGQRRAALMPLSDFTCALHAPCRYCLRNMRVVQRIHVPSRPQVCCPDSIYAASTSGVPIAFAVSRAWQHMYSLGSMHTA